jgi:hypothetical protein
MNVARPCTRSSGIFSWPFSPVAGRSPAGEPAAWTLRGSGGELRATTAATGFEDGLASAGRHPVPETVLPGAFPVVWLKCALHLLSSSVLARLADCSTAHRAHSCDKTCVKTLRPCLRYVDAAEQASRRTGGTLAALPEKIQVGVTETGSFGDPMG